MLLFTDQSYREEFSVEEGARFVKIVIMFVTLMVLIE